jgi:hypothetical protein
LQVSCGEITSDLPDHLNYCVIFIVYTECTNVAVGHIIQPGTQLVGRAMHYMEVSIPLHVLAALFLWNETPVPFEWEAGWAPELVRVF